MPSQLAQDALPHLRDSLVTVALKRLVVFTENGMAGVSAMTSVVVSALCSLSKRYLVMEGAAAGVVLKRCTHSKFCTSWDHQEHCLVACVLREGSV